MNPEALTSLLRHNGFLQKAEVTSVNLTPIKTTGIASEFFLAELGFSSTEHALPSRMAVKRPSLSDRGQGEADVYEQILGYKSGLPIMTCYGILDEGSDKPLSFLFDDLTESHEQTRWPVIPGLSDCKGAVGTLARVHAHWWGNVQGAEGMTPPVAAHQDATHLSSIFPTFVDFVGEYLSPARLATYERVLGNLDALLSQRLNADNTTLLHTDSHFWNFLYTKDKSNGETVIFDWPLWRTGLAGSDLAYMIALHLYPEHRRRFEPVLLDRYTQVLQEQGIAQSREDVGLDYRIGILVGLLMPVMEFSWNNPPYIWMPKLEKALSAFNDLDCGELI